MTAKYTRANGYEADCDVIYGDTDSVMVHFRARARTTRGCVAATHGAVSRNHERGHQCRSSLS